MLYCHQKYEFFIFERNFEHYFNGDSQPGVCEQHVGVLKMLNFMDNYRSGSSKHQKIDENRCYMAKFVLFVIWVQVTKRDC